MTSRIIPLVAIMLVLAPAVVAPVVGAQEVTPTGDAPTGSTPVGGGPPTPEPVPGSPAANNSTGNGSGWLGVPNPIDPIMGAVDWAIGGVVHEAVSAIETGVEYIAILFSGMPAPGSLDDPASIVHPEDGLWGAVYDTWLYALALGVIANVGGFMMSLSRETPVEQFEEAKQHAVGLFMALATFPIAGVALHVASAISLAIAPGPEDFLGSVGGISRLVGGGLFGIVVAYFATGVVLTGMFALLMQYVLVHVTVFLWPLGWTLLPYRGSIRSWGIIPLYLFSLLIGLKLVQSIILRFLFFIPWDAGLGPVLGPLVTFAGLAYALGYLPKEFINQASEAASVGLGMSRAEKADKQTLQNAKSRVGHEVDRVKEWRKSDATTDNRSSPNTGGVPGTDSPGVSSGSSMGSSKKAGQFGNPSRNRSTETDSNVDPNRGYQ